MAKKPTKTPFVFLTPSPIYVKEIDIRLKKEDNEEYACIQTNAGASLMCFTSAIWQKIAPGNSYLFEGNLKIKPGALYLEITKVKDVHGKNLLRSEGLEVAEGSALAD